MKKSFCVSIVLFSLFLFFWPLNVFAQEKNRTVITIENARSTQYEKDKETGNDVILLSGDVKVSVEKGGSKNVISADEIKYDRVSEMMYAVGNVSLEQTTSSSGGMNVTATSLMFNTSTLEGIFDDGRVVQTKTDAINLPAGSTLIVASDIFGRSESNTIAFKDGVLTFCDDEDPHWKIKASRIWLLPGGEFAFVNALLFVGPVPVFYFPAFYYPNDELVFNPVFGYRAREGYFIQTTTYLFGRKPLDTSGTKSSGSDSENTEKLKALFNFIKPSSLKEQELEGLVLHNLDKDFSGDTSKYVKLTADYYSNVGITTGISGVLKPNSVVSSLDFGVNLGFTNTVFRNGSDYIPYAPSGEKYYQKSNFLGIELPFRYGTNFKMSISKPFSLTLSLPAYSDPFFNDDFSDRQESMDWISYLIDSANKEENDDSISEVSSFTWNLSGSYAVPLPSAIKPFLSSLSLNLSSSVAFSSTATTDFSSFDIKSADEASWKTYSSQRKFYYPSQITPVTFSASFGGTIFDYSSSKTVTKKNNEKISFATPMVVPESLVKETDNKKDDRKDDLHGKETIEELNAVSSENADGTVQSNDDGSSEKEAEVHPLFTTDALPSISVPSVSIVTIPGIDFSMKYTIKPNITTQLAYPSEGLSKPEDFDWKQIRSSMYTLKIPVTLNNSFSYGGSFFSVSNNWNFDPVFQEHPYIWSSNDVLEQGKGAYTEEAAKSLRKTDYAAQKRDLTNTNSVSFKPFAYIKSIKDTGITWRSTIKVVRTEFIGDADNPEWEYNTTDWSDEKSITLNSLDFTFASNQRDNLFTQSLILTTTLPPQPDQYYGTLKFGFPFVSATFESGIKRKSSTDDTWVKQPFKQNLSLSLFNNTLKLSESYNYNIEDSHHDAMKISLSWQALQAAYTMSYTYGYDFDSSTGWVQRDKQEFLPYSFSLSYAPSTKTLYTWKNRVSLGLGLSTSVVADLLKPTSSYFTFSPTISFKINEFLTFSFTSTSKNSVIYRYFGNENNLPGETNLFVDLLNSFRFDDEDLRKASGFKLKSMKFDITHEMHDWDFNLSFKVEPRLLTENGKKSYDFSPYMTISVLWRPMAAMKTEIIDEYGEWKLK